ncbi:MAG: hypothetical protein LAO03_14665 [Acidobacteriia bacterium]|nr:hypothetical protein [Terriglobia bacterium]
MKRIAYVCLCGLLLAGVMVPLAGAQSGSLGDYARAVRKDKNKKTPAVKQFDNDNLPAANKLSVVGKAPEETADKTVDGEAAAEAQTAQPAEGDQAPATAQTDQKSDNTAAQSAEEKQQMYKDWQKKISTQKDQVDLLARELDVVQREYRLRAAAFYADAGNRLRSSGSWDQEDAQYKQQIADKQKALDKAKEALDDLQEQARKAGVPSGMRE